MDNYKIINSVDEITEEDILNNTKYRTPHSSHWFDIEKDKEEGYCVYGIICGDMPTHVTIGQYVKFWKTLNGVKRAIKRFAIKNYWGFHLIFPQENKG